MTTVNKMRKKAKTLMIYKEVDPYPCTYPTMHLAANGVRFCHAFHPGITIAYSELIGERAVLTNVRKLCDKPIIQPHQIIAFIAAVANLNGFKIDMTIEPPAKREDGDSLERFALQLVTCGLLAVSCSGTHASTFTPSFDKILACLEHNAPLPPSESKP